MSRTETKRMIKKLKRSCPTFTRHTQHCSILCKHANVALMLRLFTSSIRRRSIDQLEDSTDLSVSCQVVEERPHSPLHSAGCNKAREHAKAYERGVYV